LAQIFLKWTNKLPVYLLVGLVILVFILISFIWYYGFPEYTDAGYRPEQPVAFSHKLPAVAMLFKEKDIIAEIN